MCYFLDNYYMKILNLNNNIVIKINSFKRLMTRLVNYVFENDLNKNWIKFNYSTHN